MAILGSTQISGTLTVNNCEVLAPGIIQQYAGNSIPSGWFLCDGSAISRIKYAKLFNIIGTMYGTGDNVSTFNIPDLLDKTSDIKYIIKY